MFGGAVHALTTETIADPSCDLREGARAVLDLVRAFHSWGHFPTKLNQLTHPLLEAQVSIGDTTRIPQSIRTPAGTTGLLWSIAPVWYVLCEAIAASGFEGYSYATFYISDLGVPEFGEFDGRELASSLPQVMNAGFIGTGLLFLLGLAALIPHLRPGVSKPLFAASGVLHAAGIIFVGLVPGSPTNLNNGFMIIHVLGAFAAIGGGNLTAILSTSAFQGMGVSHFNRTIGMILGLAGLLSATILTLHWMLPDGVWERGAVYPFMLWQLLTGIALLRSSQPEP